MASSANPIEKGTVPIPGGVPSLRAGEGNSFLLRRLHSLSGIVPIGAFLLEHFISNSEALKGPAAYNDQVRFLTGLPFVAVLEWVFIFLPLLYHGLYGLYIWYRGESNVGEYPWTGNWLYTAQRWTGIVALFYICYHLYYMRFSGVHLMDGGYNSAFWKVQHEFQNPWAVAAYVIGITAASWHFSYGVWLFCAKWGITVGERARKKLGYVCVLLAVALISIGMASIYGFLSRPLVEQPASVETYDSSQLR